MAKWTIRAFTPGLLWLCASCCFLSGCTNNAGLSYARLHVDAQTASGDPALVEPVDNCTTLPVLRGSRVQTDVSVGLGLSLRVDATRDSAVVRRLGDAPEVLREISVDDLDSGYSESLTLDGEDGQSYAVTLTSSCPRKAETGGSSG